jgi:hypothetical protein
MTNMEPFYEKLAASHPHRRSVTVEIAVPRNLVKCLGALGWRGTLIGQFGLGMS